jgi:hypothetical protein
VKNRSIPSRAPRSIDASLDSFRHFDYISQRKSNVYTRRHHNLTSIPPELDRKAYLLRYFEDYMAKTLRRDVPWTFEDVERKKNMDFLVKYYRMKNAIVFKMSNDILQVRDPLLLSRFMISRIDVCSPIVFP